MKSPRAKKYQEINNRIGSDFRMRDLFKVRMQKALLTQPHEELWTEYRVTLAGIHLVLRGRYVTQRKPVQKQGMLMTWTRAATAAASAAVGVMTKKRTIIQNMKSGGNGGLSCVKCLYGISGGFGNCAH